MVAAMVARARQVSALLAAMLLAACGGGSVGEGPKSSGESFAWLISSSQVVDGGPGQDGIRSVDDPEFLDAASTSHVPDDDYVIALRVGGEVRVYPHNILNWHEIVNDNGGATPVVLSYCPLTGSGLAWQASSSHPDKEFGVSGLLYNSNLILYDRATGSRWSQMLEKSVWGSRAAEIPQKLQVIETKFSTLRAMYPAAKVMTRNTGFTDFYTAYPYDDYREDESLLFPVAREDNRLHPKTRVIGIRAGTDSNKSKTYQLDGFGPTTQTINDQFLDQPIVVVGNSAADVAAIYSRELADGTILNFSPLQDQLPNIMTDKEGNVWDAFGLAVSGPRAGTELRKTESYTAFWFAWAAFHRNPAIHFN